MDSVLGILVLLAAGVLLLARGASWLVGGSSEIARRLGVSALMVGLTTVAWGTSAPEVVVSGVAAWRGQPELSLGNVLGSNVANIGLVLGLCSVILPAVLDNRMGRREVTWLFAALGGLWLACWDGGISRLEAAGLIGLFALHNLHLIATARRGIDPELAAAAAAADVSSKYPLREVLVGVLALAAGAEMTVRGATLAAQRIGISDHVIGLTVVAVGTSLPELVAGVVAALRRQSEISLGNVVGSNVFNLTAALGVTALIHPFDPAEPEAARSVQSALSQDLPAVLLFSVLAVVLPALLPGRAGRAKGAVLLVAYAAYVAIVLT